MRAVSLPSMPCGGCVTRAWGFHNSNWDGAVVIASGPRGRDQPALRRAQALVCSGVIPKAAVAIAREILQCKVRGKAEVARLMGSADAAGAIGQPRPDDRRGGGRKQGGPD